MYLLHLSHREHGRHLGVQVENEQRQVVFAASTVKAALSWLWLHDRREVQVETDRGPEVFLVERNLDLPNDGSIARLRRRPPGQASGQDASQALTLPLAAETRQSQSSATGAKASHRRRRGVGRRDTSL